MPNRFTIAGKELLKGNIGNALSVVTKSYQSQLLSPGAYRNGNYFFGIKGDDKAFVWGNSNSSLVAYQTCPVVASIINRKAQCMVNGKRQVLGLDGKLSTKEEALAIEKLFKKPNIIQSGLEFEAQTSVYKQIYGYCAILVMKPLGFEKDISSWSMWNLPPWMVTIEDNTTGNVFFDNTISPFKSIKLNYMGQVTELPLENVLILKENQISTGIYNQKGADNQSLFLPDSKLSYVRENINNLNSSLNSRGSLITERGPQWILTNDQSDSGDAGLFPVDPEVKETLHKDFLQYGVMRGQKKAIITDAKLKLQTVGFDVAQLKLLEGEVQDAKAICDALNYPPEMLGIIEAKFNNKSISERALYTNAIIPDSESEDEQWANFLQLEKIGLTLKSSFHHLAVMQDDAAVKGTGRLLLNQALKMEWEAGLITKNRWLEILNEPTLGVLGDVRITDTQSKQPLASIIGVGGVQSLLGVLTAAGLSEQARSSTIQIVFGISQQEADLMTIAPTEPQQLN